MTADLTWQLITTRSEARSLQHFTCATDHPRSEGGRRLPPPRLWEWEAQRHLRQLSHLLQPGDVVLLAYQREQLVGCAHVQFDDGSGILEVFIAAVGVAMTARRRGGQVADALLARARSMGLERASSLDCEHVVVTGKIHVHNVASQHMAARAD